jgi:hypothetical protein
MKCISCNSPVPPEFKSAIKLNICPACGGAIMNSATLDLLEDIKDALEKMPNDPEGIAGWLLTHYEMRKVGSGEPVSQFYGDNPRQNAPKQSTKTNQFYQSGSAEEKEDQLRNNPKIAENKLQQFLQRANVPQQQQKNKAFYASMAQQIQDEPQQPDYPEGENDPMEEANFPDYTNAALGAMSTTEKPMTRAEMREMQQRFAAQAGEVSEQSEWDPSLSPALNQDRMNRLQKQQEFMATGKIGKISRSS